MELDARQAYLVRKALAIAVLAIERQEGALQPVSDMNDMRQMLEQMVGDETVLAHLQRSARIAVTGQP
jgi:hypothetical protein